MTLLGPFQSAARKKIQKLSENRATLIHPPMIGGRTRQTDPKRAVSNQIVYPNENENRPEK